MNGKIVGVIFLGILAISCIVPVINAPPWPSLPSTIVQITVVDGTSSYFRSTLSEVPAGYDVKNGVYPGWCVDRSTNMVRSVAHGNKLYSSLSPPASVSGINWKAINYIINHKQGTRMDIQKAIWYFTNGYTTLTTNAWAMVNAAKANSNFDPSTAPILAVICLPETSTGVQKTIIELNRGLPGLSPGYWKHNVKVYNGGPGSYSAPSDSSSHETDESMEAYALTILSNHRSQIPSQIVTGPELLVWANSQFQNVAFKSQWLKIANWFNEAAGRNQYPSS